MVDDVVLPCQLGVKHGVTLSIAHHCRAGALPDSWGSFTTLKVIDLAGSGWTPGSSPAWPSWGNLANLELLDLSNGNTQAFDSEWNVYERTMRLQTQLRKLCVLTNKWLQVMEVVHAWVRWSSLTHASCVRCPLSSWMAGPIPATWWSGMSSLQYLNLAGNMWSAPLDANWAGNGSLWLYTLSFLDLGDNPVSPAAIMSYVDIPGTWTGLQLSELRVSLRSSLCAAWR